MKKHEEEIIVTMDNGAGLDYTALLFYAKPENISENPKKHKNEIILWALAKEGTMVWCKRKGDKNWIRQKTPSWLPCNDYIVDTENALERMRDIENNK